MKKTLIFMVLLVNLFFGQVVFAMEDPNTIINSVKGVVAHECDNYFDAFGKAHCACSGNIDGVKFDLNFCNPNNRVLYYKSNGMFSDYDEVRSSIVLRSTNSDPTCNMVFSAGLTVKGSSVSCAYKREIWLKQLVEAARAEFDPELDRVQFEKLLLLLFEEDGYLNTWKEPVWLDEQLQERI
jgi:hypothetical protein